MAGQFLLAIPPTGPKKCLHSIPASWKGTDSCRRSLLYRDVDQTFPPRGVHFRRLALDKGHSNYFLLSSWKVQQLDMRVCETVDWLNNLLTQRRCNPSMNCIPFHLEGTFSPLWKIVFRATSYVYVLPVESSGSIQGSLANLSSHMVTGDSMTGIFRLVPSIVGSIIVSIRQLDHSMTALNLPQFSHYDPDFSRQLPDHSIRCFSAH